MDGYRIARIKAWQAIFNVELEKREA